MKITKIILFFALFVFCRLQLVAQDYTDNDTVIVEDPVPYDEEGYDEPATVSNDAETRKYERLYMDENKLEALRRKKEFQYPDMDSLAAADTAILKPSAKNNTRSDRFEGFDANILLWLIVAIGVIVIVLQLAGVNMRQLFSPARLVEPKDGEQVHENIHEIPYDSAIKQAISAKKYSLATRLMYLQSLKLLSDKNMIQWHENKTNWQYVYELKNEKLRNSFRDITHIFEYVQYGHMSLSEEKFAIVQNAFSNFKMNVN